MTGISILSWQIFLVNEGRLKMYLADTILGQADKQKYDNCLAHIKDAYIRMSTNKDTSYQGKQMELAGKMLDGMVELMDNAVKSVTIHA
jgi:hypothetical protein